MLVRNMLLGLAIAACAAPASAGPITLGFDDLVDLQTPIPDGYGGLNWQNMWVVNGDTAGTSGYLNGMVSPDNVAYNNRGNEASVNGPGSFTFDSAYFTAAWNDGLTVTIGGYSGGTKLNETAFTVDTAAPTLVTLNWAGLDELTFDSSGGTNAGLGGNGTQFVIDDFTYELGGTVAVPEPYSIVLCGVTGIFIASYLFGRRVFRFQNPTAG